MPNIRSVITCLSFRGALAGRLLDAKAREELALLIAQENGFDCCLSADTAIDKMVGLKHEEIVASCQGNGNHPKTTAAHFGARHADVAASYKRVCAKNQKCCARALAADLVWT